LKKKKKNDDGDTSASKPRIIITGTAYSYDIFEHLSRLRKELMIATHSFEVVEVVVFENDSQDQTRETLEVQWNLTWSVDVIGENGINARFDNRRKSSTKILAYARNSTYPQSPTVQRVSHRI